MFGHLNLNFSNDDNFRVYLCSLCETLGKEYGSLARFLANYDMAMLPLFLLSMDKLHTDGSGKKCDENPAPTVKKWCPLLSKNELITEQNTLFRFAASLTVMLTAEKVKDDILDEKKRFPKLFLKWIGNKERKARQLLPGIGFDPLRIEKAFETQRELENDNNSILIELTHPTGQVMAYIYGHGATIAGVPERKAMYANIGYQLGRIIYILDSFADYNNDMQSGAFNPLKCCSSNKIRLNSSIPEGSGSEALKILNAAMVEIEELVAQLPGTTQYLKEILTTRLNERVNSYVTRNDTIVKERTSWFRKLMNMSPSSLLSMPGLAFASDGRSGGSNCVGTLVSLAILFFACNCILSRCGVSGCCHHRPKSVTVDQPCGGSRTYHRDPCTGRYREGGCC